jgi:hypothetical protein
MICFLTSYFNSSILPEPQHRSFKNLFSTFPLIIVVTEAVTNLPSSIDFSIVICLTVHHIAH